MRQVNLVEYSDCRLVCGGNFFDLISKPLQIELHGEERAGVRNALLLGDHRRCEVSEICNVGRTIALYRYGRSGVFSSATKSFK